MPQTATKTTQERTQHKPALAAEAKDASASVHEHMTIGLNALPNAMELCNRMMTGWMEISGGALKALTESCSASIRACSSLSTDLADSGNRSLSQMMELSKEAANCRTINSVLELQQKAVQQAMETCMDTTQKFSAQIHECCMESLNPLQEQVAQVSETIGKAMATTGSKGK